MRRKDREIKDKALIDNIINRAAVCRIAMSDGNRPYIVPMNFGYRDGCIYLHSAREGRKIDILRENSHVCFEMETDPVLVKDGKPCEWGMKYCSVIGFGIARLVDDFEEKKKALDIIMEKYSGENSFEYDEKAVDRVIIIKIIISSITGKKSM